MLFYLGGGAILIGMLNWKFSPTPPLRVIGILGTYSYSIYLWHMPVYAWMTPAIVRCLPGGLADSWYIYAVIYVAGSFIFGVIFSRLIEFPAIRIRDRIFPAANSAIRVDAG